MEPRPNWIDGAAAPAHAGGYFEVAGGRGGTWSRSSSEDVQLALASLARGAAAWFDRAEPWAAPDLRRVPDPGGLVRAAIGLKADESPSSAEALAPPIEPAPGPAIAVVRRSWTEGVAGLAAAVMGELAAGRVVLLLSDPHVPALAEGLVLELLERGLPTDALALLHDDGDVALRAAAQAACAVPVGRVLLSGDGDQRDRLATLLERARSAGGFGSGVVAGDSRQVVFELLLPATYRVQLDDDPQVAAEEVARWAFGREESLSGQAADRVGRVLVHPRRLSRFTCALLAELEGQGAPDPSLAPVERDLPAFLERVRAQGLDEGATLIHEARDGSNRAAGSGRITRLVFTNVETHMRLWGLARPAPVLLLARLPGGEPR